MHADTAPTAQSSIGRISRSSRDWWGLLMLVLISAYLIPEFVFNVQLVSIAGGRSLTDAELRSVELYGRAISGVGVTLLLADWLIRGWLLRRPLRAAFALVVLALLIWPAVFFGQKWLIEHWLIEPSTPAQRQQAVFSQLLRSGLANDTIRIEGVPFDPHSAATAAEQTFLTVFGGLLYADAKLLSSLESQRQRIAEDYVRNHAYAAFDGHYARYQQLRTSLRTAYEEYREATVRYERELADVPNRVNDAWRDVEQRVLEGWGEYGKAKQRLHAEADSRATQIAPKLYDYFQRREACRTSSCLQRLNAHYERETERAGLGGVEPDFWLIEREISTSENLLKTGVMAVLSGGVSLVAQGLDKAAGGDGSWKNKEYLYTNEPGHYRERLLLLSEERFVRDTGYPSNIGELMEFRLHPTTGSKLSTELGKSGLQLPPGWTLAQPAVFREAANRKARADILQAWQRSSRQQGVAIEPGFSWLQFQQSAAIQQTIRAQMGEFYVAGMRADWNNAAFKQHVVDPNINRKANQLVAEVGARASEFADGGPYAERGKQALRATLVPPISMTLSLFLVVATLIKLPCKAWLLFRRQRRAEGRPRFWVVPAVHAALLAIVLLVPLLFTRNEFTAGTSAIPYFLERIEESSHAGTALALKWTLNFQPALVPAGLRVEQHLALFGGFQAAVEPGLERWENALGQVAARFEQVRR